MRNILFMNKSLAPPKDQGADFVELFFDLVFVYAITRITALSAHDLDTYHLFRSILIFWMIWWGWTQFTWSLNAANTKLAGVRMTVLIATAVAFVMASSVGGAFGDGVLWFAIPYVIIRTIGIGFSFLVEPKAEGPDNRVLSFAIPSFLGLAAVLIGAFAEPAQRVWWWLGVIVFDFIAGYLGGKKDGWDIKADHFSERHGLIVIIALGESLIIAAHTISAQDRSSDLLIVGGLAVLVTCLLWWSYFSWIHEHLGEHLSRSTGSKQATMARDAYSIFHFPLICGIIGIAVGFEKIIGHPHDLLSIPVAIALGGGYIVYAASTALSVWRMSKQILLPRIVILALTSAALVFSVGRAPYYALAMIAVSLIMITFLEWRKCRLSH